MEIAELLNYISQFGVLPILLIIVLKLWQKIGTLETELKAKNNEIREIERENVSLMYKCIAALKKFKGEQHENEEQ